MYCALEYCGCETANTTRLVVAVHVRHTIMGVPNSGLGINVKYKCEQTKNVTNMEGRLGIGSVRTVPRMQTKTVVECERSNILIQSAFSSCKSAQCPSDKKELV